jgi:small subunit ribosomal protein S4
MARYLDSVCRLCRRENQKLFLKGERCYTEKCAFERRQYPPGQHGQGRPRFSEYGVQLREKQKVRRIYGILERQFRRYFKASERQKGVTGENLLLMLERRLDNLVYRMGFASSRSEARQLVRHSHFLVNGKKTNLPGFLCKPGDVVEVKESSRKIARINDALEALPRREQSSWIATDRAAFKATFKDNPSRDDLTVQVQEQLIVELYSK